jgi:hypothetical protein
VCGAFGRSRQLHHNLTQQCFDTSTDHEEHHPSIYQSINKNKKKKKKKYK